MTSNADEFQGYNTPHLLNHLKTISVVPAHGRASGTTAVMIAAMAIVVLVLYTWRLGDSPMYLFHDEVFFGVQAHAIATTGRDTHGRFLPLYFEVFDGYWFQPITVYFTALFFRVLPITEATLRLPGAIVGVIDVILVYLVGARLFRNRLLALSAAAILTMTPAHFLLSRQAVDPIYPVPFLLGWLWCLVVYVDERRSGVLFLGTTLLGLGFYSYIAAQAMMALYLLTTLAILAATRASRRAYGLALAGFMWPLVASIPFHTAHPEFLADTLGRYAPRGGQQLNPLQQIRELLNYGNVTARVTLYFNYFNPAYLFLSGAPDIIHSTRLVGVFLLPLALFIPFGIAQALQPPRTPINVLIVTGFATAPVAALVVMDGGAINRESELLPFGVLLAVIGIRRLFSAPLRSSIRWIYLPCCGVGIGLAVAYGVWSAATTGSIGGSVLPLAIVSAVVYTIGRASERARSWRPITAALLLVGIVQFTGFYRDYFTDYRFRSAARFEGNVRGAIEEVIQRQDPGRPSDVYLSETFPFFESFWRFYAAKHRRDDLPAMAHRFNPITTDVGQIGYGSFIVAVAGARDDEALARRSDLAQVARVWEPDGRLSFLILRKART